MRNAKKTLSLVMVAIFTTFIVLSGIPAGAVTTAQAKAQVTKATAAVVKVEKTVKVATFNPTTAQTQLTAANKEVAKVKSLGKTYAKTYTALAARTAAVAKKITARKAAILKIAQQLAKLYSDANKAVEAAEKATDADIDLVADAAALAEAQGAVTAALEFIVKLDKNSSNYKGLMARVDAANNVIVDAMAQIEKIAADEEAAKRLEEEAKLAAEALKAAVAAAETAVTAAEKAPLVTAADVTSAKELSKTAATAVAAVKDAEQAAPFSARVKVVDDKIAALEKALAEAAIPATITVAAADELVTVTFSKATTAAAADFVITKTVGTAAAAAVTPGAVTQVSETVTTIKVPATETTATEQSVKYTVAYKGQTAVEASYKVPAVAITVAATDTNKIEVKFDRVVTPANVTVALKKGAATTYTTTTFAADNKSAILTAPVAIAADTYDVVVTGLVAAEVKAPITIVAAAAKTMEITTAQATYNTSAKVAFSVKNQYGTDMGIFGNATTFTAYDVTANANIPVTAYDAAKSEVTIDLTVATTAGLKVGDDIRIIGSYLGLTVTKTIKVMAAAAATDMTLGTVAPLTNKTRITVAETGFTLPYTLKDQYGTAMTLTAGAAGAATVAGTALANNPAITFVSSNTGIVDPATFAVDANGKLTFNAGATAGTVTITAIINATGKVATTQVVVSAAAALKTVAITAPTALIAANDANVSLAIAGVDQYGAATTNFGTVVVTSSVPAVATASIIAGKLVVDPVGAGTTVITLATADGSVVYGTISIKVEAAAVATAITGLVAGTPTTYEVGAVKEIGFSKFAAKDQYGRAYTLAAAEITATLVDAANTVFTNAVTATGYNFTAGAAAGTQQIKFALANGASYTVTMTAVASSSITSYTITNVPTVMYAQAVANAAYDVALTLGGKLADGTSVVLAAGKVAIATSTNPSVATVSATGTVTGLTKGTTTITLMSSTGAVLATAAITVNDATPVATSVSIDDSTPFTVAVAATVDVNANLEVLDQYGVALANTGFWASSDASVATVNAAGVVTGVAAGTANITFVTGNGIVVKTTVTVQ